MTMMIITMGMMLVIMTMDMMLMRFSVNDDRGTDNEIRVSNAVSDGYDDVNMDVGDMGSVKDEFMSFGTLGTLRAVVMSFWQWNSQGCYVIGLSVGASLSWTRCIAEMGR